MRQRDQRRGQGQRPLTDSFWKMSGPTSECESSDVPKSLPQHAADPLQVAQPAGLIQPKLMPQRGQRLGRSTGPQHDRRHVARQHIDHHKHQHRGQPQG